MKQNIVLRLLILSFLVSPFVEICNGYSGNIPKITRTRGTDDDINGEDNDIDGEEPEVLDGGFSGHIPRIIRTRPTANEDEFEVIDEVMKTLKMTFLLMKWKNNMTILIVTLLILRLNSFLVINRTVSGF